MTQWDILEALGDIAPRHLKSLDLLYKKEPMWRYVMKKSVKFAAAAAAVVVALGVIAFAAILQTNPQILGGFAAPGSSCHLEVQENSGNSQGNFPMFVENYENDSSGVIKIKQYDPITVCVEPGFQQYAQSLLTYLKKQDGVDLNLTVLPQNAAERETALSNMRVEIMAGGGPDVFVTACTDPNMAEPVSVLFPYPEKSLCSKVFLPLDDLMENSRYMAPESLEPKIMEAGKTEEGQMILPLTYTYSVLAFSKDALEGTGSAPRSWGELLTCDSLPVQQCFGSMLSTNFYEVFGEVADPEKERLLISEDELLTRSKEGARLAEKAFGAETEIQPVSGGSLGESSFQALSGGQEHQLIPFYNTQGGVTASITMFAAINRNTRHPEMAFAFLDALFSDQVMSGKGFLLEEDGTEKWYGNLLSFGAVVRGIPVSTVWEEAHTREWSDSDKRALEEIKGKIDTVRFFSFFDQELLNAYFNCRSARDEQEQAEAAAKACETMKMLLAES